MSKISRSTLWSIIVFLIFSLIVSFRMHWESTNELREKYEEKLLEYEFPSSYDDESYWAGYDHAKDCVEDWFDSDYDYYIDIYMSAYNNGYNHGYDDGVEDTTESVEDWYEGANR